MPNGFADQIGGVNFNFDTVPDLQPRALRGIVRMTRLPEENVLRSVVPTVPVADKLFQNMLDDQIDTRTTPEVDMNADDPMLSDSFKFTLDQVHEYRQATQLNQELGRQLLNPPGTPGRYAGMSLLQRYIGSLVICIDNRRELNRAMAMVHAHEFDRSRLADLSVNNVINLTDYADQWDNPAKDVQGNRIVNPFNQLSAAKERFAFLTGAYPNCIVVSSDIYSAMETHENWATERSNPVMAGARARVRDLDIFVSIGRMNIGTPDTPKLVPMMENQVVMCRADATTISEKQYDINRLEQFTTANRLFYYVRFWHKSKVTVEAPTKFFYIKNVLKNPFSFDSVSSLIKT